MNVTYVYSWIFLLMVSLVPALLVHELTHFIAAAVSGFSIEGLTLGPLRAWRRNGRFKYRWINPLRGAMAHLEPGVRRERRTGWRLVPYAVLPPLLSGTAAVCGLVWASTRHGTFPALMLPFAVVELFVVAITLAPWRYGGRASDGQLLFGLLTNSRARRWERAMFFMLHDSQTARIRDLDRELLRETMAPGGGIREYLGYMLGYYAALDSGDRAEAEVVLCRLQTMPLSRRAPSASQIQVERAYIAAFLDGDSRAAATLLAAVGSATSMQRSWIAQALKGRTGFALRYGATVLKAHEQLGDDLNRSVEYLIERYGPAFGVDVVAEMTEEQRRQIDFVAAAAAELSTDPALSASTDLASSLLRSSAHGEFSATREEQDRVNSLVAAGFTPGPIAHRCWQTGFWTGTGGWIIILWGLMAFRLAAGGWAVTRAGSRYSPLLPAAAIPRAHMLFGIAAVAALTMSVLVAWILYLRLGRGFVRLTLLLFIVAAIAAAAGQSLVDPAGIGIPGIGWVYAVTGLLGLPLLRHAWGGTSNDGHETLDAPQDPAPRSLDRLLWAGGLPLVLAFLLVGQTRLQFASDFTDGGASTVSAQDLKHQPGTLHATYVFDDGLSEPGRQAVIDAVLRGDRYLRQTLGASVAQPIVVNVHASDSRAVQYDAAPDGHAITVNAPSMSGGPTVTPGMEADVVRGLFQVMEGELSQGQAFARGPSWLATGSVELVARQALIDDGYFSADESRACLLQALHLETARLPALSVLAQRRSSNDSGADAVALATLAASSATAHTGLASLTTYFSRVATMDGAVAFQTTFGLSLGDFYRQFSGERASFRSPVGATCSP